MYEIIICYSNLSNCLRNAYFLGQIVFLHISRSRFLCDLISVSFDCYRLWIKKNQKRLSIATMNRIVQPKNETNRGALKRKH